MGMIHITSPELYFEKPAWLGLELVVEHLLKVPPPVLARKEEKKTWQPDHVQTHHSAKHAWGTPLEATWPNLLP